MDPWESRGNGYVDPIRCEAMSSSRRIVPSLLLLAAALPAAEPVVQGEPIIVVGSVSRLEDPPVYQPYAYYRQDREDLDRANQASPVEALDHTPGVAVQKTAGNQSSPYVRGLTGEQTLLMFDGVRLNHAAMRPGPNQYSAMLPGNAVDSVDVLLGSSGTVQGSDGLTGTLDFRMAEAGRGTDKVASPWVSTRQDTADGATLSAGVDGAIGGFLYSVDGSRGWYGDRRGGKDAGDHLFGDAADGRDIPNSGYDQYDFGGRVAYVGLARNRFELSGGQVKQWDAPRADGYFENSGNPNNISRFYDPQQFDYIHARHIFAGEGSVPRIQTTGWWHRHQEDQIREDLQGGNRYRRRETDDQVTTIGIDLQLTSRIATHEVTYGATWYEDRTANEARAYRSPALNTDPDAAEFDPALSQPGTTTLPDGSRYQGLGVFAPDLRTIAPAWDVLVGLRWSRSSWKSDVTADRPGYATYTDDRIEGDANALTANGRIGWHPIEDSTIFAGVSQGFRAPNLTNLAGIQSRASNNTIQVEGNPDLDPEKSLTYEIGSKIERMRDNASLTFFYTRIDDLIQNTYIDANGDGSIGAGDRSVSSNAESAELAGFELGEDWGVLASNLPTDSRLSIFNVVNATTGEADEQNPTTGQVDTVHISRANRVFGMGGITYEPTNVWYVTFQTRWSMAYKEVNVGDGQDVRHTTFQAKDRDPGAMPGYAVLDFKAGWAPNRSLRVDAAVENLLDHTYREVGSGIDGAGLAGVLRVTARY